MQNQNPKPGYKFFKFREYSKIVLAEIPKDWDIIRLGSATFPITKGTTPTTEGQNFVDTGIPFFKVESINDDGTVNEEKLDYISEETHEKLKRSQVHHNDVLFSIAGTIGKSYLVEPKFDPSNTNQALSIIRIKDNLISNEFLTYFLDSNLVKNQTLIEKTTLTQSNLSLKQVSNIRIAKPCFDEQQKIASILSNIDYLIQKTNSIIKQTQLFKKGIMNILFTKGVGNPKFKQVDWLFRTQIEVHEDWKLKKFKKIFSDVMGGTPLKPEDFVEDGFPVLHKGDIKPNNRIKISEINPFCTTKFADDYKEHIVDTSFLVVTLRDLIPSGPSIGLIAQCDDSYLLAQGAYGFHVDEKEIDPNFLIQLSNSHLYRQYIKSRSVGSTQIHIRTPDFLKMEFWVPSIPEQQKIASILSNIDSKIHFHFNYKSNLELLKKGLMHKLMTGKIRVKF